MADCQIGYFVGSLSSTSINRILSRAPIRFAPTGLSFTEIPIGSLPLYSPDYDHDYPAEATELKAAITRSDAVMFVTPEYNRSIPGVLKLKATTGLGSYGPARCVPPIRCAQSSRRSQNLRHEPARAAVMVRVASDAPQCPATSGSGHFWVRPLLATWQQVASVGPGYLPDR